MEKINRLKKLINFFNLDGYIIPKNDEFFSEFTSENKDKLKYITKFSGSFGFAIILKKKCYLFVDGRYTHQAKLQSGKFFNIITIPNEMPSKIFKMQKLKIGYDPMLHTKRNLSLLFNKTKCKLIPLKENLIKKIWNNKNHRFSKKFDILPKKAFDQGYKFKIKKLIKVLSKKKINAQFVSSSENIAWLLNIRGKDSDFTPIPNSYLFIDINGNIYFFCDPNKIDKSFKSKFKNISFVNINLISDFLFKLKNKKVLIDSSTCSVFFENLIEKKNKIFKFGDPIYSFKSIKSKTEIKNIKKSHIFDGAALTKFLFWVKNNYLKRSIDEISAEKKLLEFRKKNKTFNFLSFPTISGSGPNGAIIHYRVSKKTNRKLRSGDIYLIDSGGQYSFGTTDVTRTISLNNKSKRVKEIFTRVLKGHISVANFKIKKNSSGSNIDTVARKSLKEINLDYAHGTGHGVGYFLNVHEGPQAISKKNKVILKKGMVISNEPGYYEVGKFGIRIENLVNIEKNKSKLFFNNLTLAPIDKSLIDKTLLKKEEVNWLNKYHKNVYENLKFFMNKLELKELKSACSKI